jgi:hypothetical protein
LYDTLRALVAPGRSTSRGRRIRSMVWLTAIVTMCGHWAGANARETLDPPTVGDFTRIRLSWSNEPYVQPYWELSKGRSVVFDSYRDKDTAVVLEKSPVWLNKFPIDCAVHWMLAQTLKANGDFAGFARHMYWYRGLIASMHRSGSGVSPKDAVKVVALREEYFFVRDMGGVIKAQGLVDIGETTYHKVRAEIAGEERTLYFDINIPYARLARNTFPAPGASAAPGAKPARVLPGS